MNTGIQEKRAPSSNFRQERKIRKKSSFRISKKEIQNWYYSKNSPKGVFLENIWWRWRELPPRVPRCHIYIYVSYPILLLFHTREWERKRKRRDFVTYHNLKYLRKELCTTYDTEFPISFRKSGCSRSSDTQSQRERLRCKSKRFVVCSSSHKASKR